MFDRLYKRPHAIARHRNGPLSDERRRYLAHCAEQQMSMETLGQIARCTLIVARALHLADRPGELITRAEIVAEAHRWVKCRRRAQEVKNVPRELSKFIGHAVRWLTFLGQFQPPAAVRQPYADLVAEFTDYMIQERGLSPRTVEYNSQQIQAFLTEIDEAKLQLKTLTGGQVNELLANKIRNRGYTRVTVRRCAAAIRPFLRFTERHEWCNPGLADAIKTPRIYSHEGLPLGPSWVDVQRLIATAKGDQPADIRDRAMLLLLAVYGLRAVEVTAVRLEDFDWEQEVLTVFHGKGQQPGTYPLCQRCGETTTKEKPQKQASDSKQNQ